MNKLTLFLLCLFFTYSFSQEYTPGYYKININQVTPDSGINTGHVIAYGHYIKPPYKIEVRDTIIFINDVQIFPMLLSDQQKEKINNELERTNIWKNTAEYKIKVKYDVEADAVYNTILKETNDTSRAVKKAIIVLMKSGLYDRITFDKHAPKNQIKFWYKGWSVPVYYHFTSHMERKVTFKVNITIADVAQQKAKSIENSLNRNRIKIFGYSGQETKSGSDIYKIANILNDTTLTPEQIIGELKCIGLFDGYELVDNYDEKEWQCLK